MLTVTVNRSLFIPLQTKSTSVGSVRLDAEAAKCLAVTEAIGELMSHAVVNVYVTEKAELDKAE